MANGGMAADEYIYTGDLAEHMTWDSSLSVMRPMTPIEIARAAIPSVTRRQMLTALHRVGLLNTIKAWVAESGDVELQIAFDEALDFERNNAFIAVAAVAFAKTDTEIDAIFALAASI